MLVDVGFDDVRGRVVEHSGEGVEGDRGAIGIFVHGPRVGPVASAVLSSQRTMAVTPATWCGR